MSAGVSRSTPRATPSDDGLRLTTDELLSTLVDLTRLGPLVDISLTITVGDPNKPSASLTHDSFGQTADGAQWRAGQGPTLTAYGTQLPSSSSDLGMDARWPRLRQVLASTHRGTRITTKPPVSSTPVASSASNADAPAVLSALAAPLIRDGAVVGVLTAYSAKTAAFEGADADAHLRRLAATCAVMLRWRERLHRAESDAANMHVALASRAPMEQAKGIVAAHLGLSLDQAFEVISRVSQDRNTKARDLAALLTEHPASRAFDDVLLTAALRLGFHPY